MQRLVTPTLRKTSNYTLTFTILWANAADDKLTIFLLFFSEIGFDISCNLSPMETICMKCQVLFSGKNQKNISVCRQLTFSSLLSVNVGLSFITGYILGVNKVIVPVLPVIFIGVLIKS